MAVIRAQVAIKTSASLVKDDMVITPHFDFGLPIAAYQDFAEDLANAVQGWQSVSAVARKIEVKLYDTAGPAPHYPVGEFETTGGEYSELSWPRELALCLSYYSEHNRKRRRGRLYVCPGWMFTATSLGYRPSQSVIDKVMALGVVLKDAGGPDVDWVVWSRRDQAARPVTDYWVDNEWDVMRKRGQKATARSVGTTSEA